MNGTRDEPCPGFFTVFFKNPLQFRFRNSSQQLRGCFARASIHAHIERLVTAKAKPARGIELIGRDAKVEEYAVECRRCAEGGVENLGKVTEVAMKQENTIL